MRQHAADNEHAGRITDAGKKYIFVWNNQKHELYFKKREMTENPEAAEQIQ